jgi:predicted GNAT family acetyltransferase
MLVQDNTTLHRFEAIVEGRVAGFIDYEIHDGRHWLIHTELEEEHQNSGVGSFLVRKTLDDLRARSVAIVPTCPFVGGWIKRHPEYQDLVDQESLREFKRNRWDGQRASAEARPPKRTGPPMAEPCVHVPTDLSSLPLPWPVEGCAECIEAGGHDWVHLRMCQACGHIGCCNDSPGKHGSAHAKLATHLLLRSYEPGENWWYCHDDDATFEVAGAPDAPSHP